MNIKTIIALPLAITLVLSPVSVAAKPIVETIKVTQVQSDETTSEGSAAGQEAERVAREASGGGFFSKPGIVGAVIVAATVALAIKAASDVVEATPATNGPTYTPREPTTTSTSTSTSTSTGTGN